jgi:hypothetical protein
MEYIGIGGVLCGAMFCHFHVRFSPSSDVGRAGD